MKVFFCMHCIVCLQRGQLLALCSLSVPSESRRRERKIEGGDAVSLMCGLLFLCNFVFSWGSSVALSTYLMQIERSRQTIQFELEDIDSKPDQEQLLFEMIHAVSHSTLSLYSDTCTGSSVHCDSFKLGMLPEAGAEVIFLFPSS